MTKEVYEKLSTDPTDMFSKHLWGMLENLKIDGTIDEKLYDFLVIPEPLIPVMCTLPKMFKNLLRPPSRPIVSGRGLLFSSVAIFLDEVLRKYVIQAKSYVRDLAWCSKGLTLYILLIDGDLLIMVSPALSPERHTALRSGPIGLGPTVLAQ